jgi:hypothetical protein
MSQLNPSPTDEIVRRGQEALERRRRGFEDWMAIAEALQVGWAEVMLTVHTNQPTGRRYEIAMAKWLLAHSFHLIDKGTRSRLRECLQHRTEIDKWRASLTEAERFRFNHPDTVLKKWKAALTPIGATRARSRRQDRRPRPPKVVPSTLNSLWWSDASLEQRRHFIEAIGLNSLLEAMSPNFRAQLERWFAGQQSASTSNRSAYR